MKHLTPLLCFAFLLSLTTLAQQQDGARPITKPVLPSHKPALVPLNDEKIEAALTTPANQASTAQSTVRALNDDLKALIEKQLASSQLKSGADWVVIEGATYLVLGDTIVPLPGGGASGCLDKDADATAARLARARAAYAQRSKKN